MPTRKIRDIDSRELRACTALEHQPPTMRVYEPGEYEHECPQCGNVVRFVVNQQTWCRQVQGCSLVPSGGGVTLQWQPNGPGRTLR